MRVILKLSAIVLLGVLMQCGIVRYADDLDEAMFIVRVSIAHAQGTKIDDAELVMAAARLHQRRCERDRVAVPQYWHHDDTALASANDV